MDWSGESTDTQARVRVLAEHLGVDTEDIEEGYDSMTFDVNPHLLYRGVSPKEAVETIKTLKAALAGAGVRLPIKRDTFMLKSKKDHALRLLDEELANAKTNEHKADLRKEYEALRLRPTYNDLRDLIKARNPAALDIGPHTVVNALYFISPETDDCGHAIDYRDTLREAWDGVLIRDRRVKYQSTDGEYMVLTDSEADDKQDECFESLLDDLVPGADSKYFNRDAWKQDAELDGRGHTLSAYDGVEHECHDKETDQYYYIYRVG